MDDNKKIKDIAIECKNISDNDLKCENIILLHSNYPNGSWYRLTGDIKPFKIKLLELRNVIYEKYPDLSNKLAEYMDKYDSVPLSYQGKIDSLLDLIIILESSNVKKNNNKKFFISHSSKDREIVKSFIDEILLLGCGFSEEDIFCTLDSTSIRTGCDFRNKIIENLRASDYILLFISENYNSSDVCKNEMGAAWAFDEKIKYPFILPGTSFDQMGFLNVVKQGASLADKRKLDEFYNEVCEHYSVIQDWKRFNKRCDEFISLLNK